MSDSETGPPRRKRVKIEQQHPLNLFFHHLLSELFRDASAKGKKSASSYLKAMHSIRKYKLPLTSASEAKVVNGVGDGIVKVFREQLDTFRQRHGGDPTLEQVRLLQAGESLDRIPTSAQPIPSSSQSETQLVTSVTPRRTASTTSAASASSSSQQIPSQPPPPIALFPGEYDVVLLADKMEIRHRPELEKELVEKAGPEDVGMEWAGLPVGDFTWIARSKSGDTSQDLVLGPLVERKRLDDLRGSIMGKATNGGQDRWRDQKQRIKGSGVPDPILLVEDHPLGHGSVPRSTLITAVNNAQVHEDFRVVWTGGIRETALYLKYLGRQVRKAAEGHILISREADDIPGSRRVVSLAGLRATSTRSETITRRQVWMRQLLLCPRMTPPKALAVAEVWPSPDAFMGALGEEEEAVMAKRIDAEISEKLGPALARNLIRFFKY